MSKESKKYANPVRKAKYEDDGVKVAGGQMIGHVMAYEKAMYKDDRPTLKLHQFVKPETKDKQENKFDIPTVKGNPTPGRKPKKSKLFTKPRRKPAPPAPPSLPKAKEVKPHSRPPKGMKNPVTVKSGTLKRGKKKK